MATKKAVPATRTIRRKGRSVTVVNGDARTADETAVTMATEVMDLYAECEAISVDYNDAAIATSADARTAFSTSKVAGDRATLEQMFADEYTFTDPFGTAGDKHSTVEAILSGKIRKDSFEYSEETVRFYGDTVVTSGVFSMKGSMRVRFRKSGAVRTRDISGRYRTTHTYVRRDERWVLMASQMTREPAPKKFTHGHPGEPDFVEG